MVEIQVEGRIAFVKLVNAGADVKVLKSYGNDVLSWVRTKGLFDIETKLLQNGWNSTKISNRPPPPPPSKSKNS